jgi:hypothetical protein
MKKRALLIVGLALAIATAGLVYAHWTETLKVDATVYTGDAWVRWTNIFTDDDGGNSIGEETGLLAPMYSSFNPAQSRDPSSFSVIDPNLAGQPVLTTAATRYDKDVAACWSGITDGLTTGYLMWVQIQNAYPSYHCTISSTLQNQGNVPMMQDANPKKFVRTVLGVTTYPIPVAGTHEGVAGYFIQGPTGLNEVFFSTTHGTLCGEQIDPLEYATTVNVFHLLNDAPQNATYQMKQEIKFVNWNESLYYGATPVICPLELLP